MSKCINCLKEIPLNEFLKFDYRCKECDKLPNHRKKLKKKCKNCIHKPHKEECTEGVVHSGPPEFKILEICGCKRSQK